MADIELVIKVPEEDYEYLKSHNKDGLYNVILKGTPLPKGHGRLIDANVLADGFEDNYEFCEEINATPTIIEADKENK